MVTWWTNRPRDFGRGAARVALLLGLTVLAYVPVLSSGFIWDDDSLLTQNVLIKSAAGLGRLWFTTQPSDYWPVTGTSFWLEWRLWGMKASDYHATNLGLHLATVLLLWTVLRRLRLPGAFLAALLFAVHPVNVESVAWIAQRKNLLALLFSLLAVLAFLRTDWETPAKTGPLYSPGARHWYLLSGLAFIAAMLSKGSAAPIPLVLLGLVWWRRRPEIRDLLRLFPFFLVAAILVGVDLWFQKHGVTTVVRSAGLLERLAGAGAILWFYLAHALWPVRLIFVYPLWKIQVSDPRWWLPAVAAGIVTLLFWRRRRQWSRPELAAWAYFGVMLVPVLGFTDVYFMRYSLVADHYEHLALIGVVAWAAFRFTTAHSQLRGAFRTAGTAVAVAVISSLAFVTWRQSSQYADIPTLCRAILARNPDCWLAHLNLGIVLQERGQTAEAISHLEAAQQIEPDAAEVHFNLGNAYTDAARPAAALGQFQAAVRLRSDYTDAYNNLGIALARSGRLAEAIPEFAAALRLRPDFAEAHFNLGVTLLHRGQSEEARKELEETLRLDPQFAPARKLLGR